MAESISYNLVIEGEDARTFFEGQCNPKKSPRKSAMFKKAKAIYRENPV